VENDGFRGLLFAELAAKADIQEEADKYDAKALRLTIEYDMSDLEMTKAKKEIATPQASTSAEQYELRCSAR
jgi:hypothetical protein